MKTFSLFQELEKNPYPGRGIVLGQTQDGENAVLVYFIMGRSENSRNRIFVEEGEGIRTEAYDLAKLEDPSLIIYSPIKVIGNRTIVSNGDHTDTIYSGIKNNLSFEESLRTREFEPDAPNYTPRISALLKIEEKKMNYIFSILKSNEGNPDSCHRFTFSYENPQAGEGHFIHTYTGKDVPALESFEGEPKKIEIKDNIDAFSEKLWNSLNPDNKISLFVRFINIKDGQYQSRLLNKYDDRRK